MKTFTEISSPKVVLQAKKKKKKMCLENYYLTHDLMKKIKK